MSDSDKKERYLKLVSENEWLLSEIKAIEQEIEDRCAGAGRQYIEVGFACSDKIMTESRSSWMSDYDPKVIYDEQLRKAYIEDKATRILNYKAKREAEETAEREYTTLVDSFVKLSKDIRDEFEASLLYVSLGFDDVHRCTVKHPDKSQLLKHAAFLERLGFKIRKDEHNTVLLGNDGGFLAVIPKALWTTYEEKHPEIHEFVCKFDRDAEKAYKELENKKADKK